MKTNNEIKLYFKNDRDMIICNDELLDQVYIHDPINEQMIFMDKEEARLIYQGLGQVLGLSNSLTPIERNSSNPPPDQL